MSAVVLGLAVMCLGAATDGGMSSTPTEAGESGGASGTLTPSEKAVSERSARLVFFVGPEDRDVARAILAQVIDLPLAFEFLDDDASGGRRERTRSALATAGAQGLRGGLWIERERGGRSGVVLVDAERRQILSRSLPARKSEAEVEELALVARTMLVLLLEGTAVDSEEARVTAVDAPPEPPEKPRATEAPKRESVETIDHAGVSVGPRLDSVFDGAVALGLEGAGRLRILETLWLTASIRYFPRFPATVGLARLGLGRAGSSLGLDYRRTGDWSFFAGASADVDWYWREETEVPAGAEPASRTGAPSVGASLRAGASRRLAGPWGLSLAAGMAVLALRPEYAFDGTGADPVVSAPHRVFPILSAGLDFAW